MAFFYDTISGLSGLAQYERYLENDLYIRNLKRYTDDPINYQLVEIKRYIGENTTTSIDNTTTLVSETKKQLEQLTKDICGTLEKGFSQVVEQLEDINWRLNDINEGISNLHSMLDWKTDVLIEEQRISNLYLGKIASLLKIPDSQKQRSYHVEQGIVYLKNAIEEGPKSDFYSDALDEFTKAKQHEEKDYFCLNKIGFIYLHSKKHLDVTMADEYFKLSSRFSKAFATATSSLNENIEKRYNQSLESTLTKETLLQETAISLNYASRCQYILTNFYEASELARQAFDINPSNPEFGMQLSKCLSANKKDHQAAEILKKVIQMDKFYAVKALTDPDFFNSATIRGEIENVATTLIQKVRKVIINLTSLNIQNSKAQEQLGKIQSIFKEQNYINARSAHDELNKKQKWEVVYYLQDSDHFSPREEKRIEELSVSEFIPIEHQELEKKKMFDENYRRASAIREKKLQERKQRILITKIILTAIVVGGSIALLAVIDGGFYRFILILIVFGGGVTVISKIWDDWD